MIPSISPKAESATFYEAEFIQGIYMSRVDYVGNIRYYQQARVNRQSGTDEFAYCIEPYTSIRNGYLYESTENPTYLSSSQIDRIAKLAYFGYGYKDHTDIKWYAITQLLIWQTSTPNGYFYFTSWLDGPNNYAFQDEINELETLVDTYLLTPSFHEQTFEVVEDHDLLIIDRNQVISTYQSNDNLTIENNEIRLENLQEGSYEYTFSKGGTGTIPALFYYSSTSQNLVKRGTIIDKVETSFKVNVKKTQLEVTKIDHDTKSTTPSGEASFEGTTYTLYDQDRNIIQEYILDNNQIRIDNLDYGTYYLKETKAGTGYLLSDQEEEIIISTDNPKQSIILENEVLKKLIKIKKLYGEDSIYQEEKNISFAIRNSKDELLSVVETNELGEIELTLPFGTYTIIQMNTTEGYDMTEPFIIEVTDSEVELIELRDIKIPVPDTYKEKNNNLLLWYLLWFLF